MSIGINVTLYNCLENPFNIIFLSLELMQSVKTVLLSLDVMIISYTPSVKVGSMIWFFSLNENIIFLSKSIETNSLLAAIFGEQP
jgi:hypothetical protein